MIITRCFYDILNLNQNIWNYLTFLFLGNIPKLYYLNKGFSFSCYCKQNRKFHPFFLLYVSQVANTLMKIKIISYMPKSLCANTKSNYHRFSHIIFLTDCIFLFIGYVLRHKIEWYYRQSKKNIKWEKEKIFVMLR